MPIPLTTRHRVRGLALVAGIVVAACGVAADGPSAQQAWRWEALPDAPLEARSHPSAVWTGEEVVIWGGRDANMTFADGASYDVAKNDWEAIALAPILGRTGHVAAWTGEEMIVWGGEREDRDRPSVPEAEEVGSDGGTDPPTPVFGAAFADGASYDPAADSWTEIAAAPFAVRPVTSALTGSALVIVGERLGFEGPVGSPAATTGTMETLAYHPTTDSWTVMAPPPFPPVRAVEGVWTGMQLMVWGGTDHDAAGPTEAFSYDPETDRWTEMPAGPLSGRQWHSVVWTGDRMIVWGGTDHVGAGWDDGAAYDPSTGEWAPVAEAPIGGRQNHLGLALDGAMIIFGGTSGPSTKSDGAAYDPGSDSWSALPEPPISGRAHSGSVALTDGLFVWGGWSFDGARERYYADGALLHRQPSG